MTHFKYTFIFPEVKYPFNRLACLSGLISFLEDLSVNFLLGMPWNALLNGVMECL